MTQPETETPSRLAGEGLGVGASPTEPRSQPDPLPGDLPSPDEATANAAGERPPAGTGQPGVAPPGSVTHEDAPHADTSLAATPPDVTRPDAMPASVAQPDATLDNATQPDATLADASQPDAALRDVAYRVATPADAFRQDAAPPATTADSAIAQADTARAGAADPDAPASAPTAIELDEEALRLAEALVFASATPVSARALTQLLPDTADVDAVLAALRARYAGRGVELVETAGGVQFRTAPELAPRLRKVIDVPRKLPRVAMETLAIIAYHQPCTRPEIEEIRGTSLSQQTLDALLEANLVAPKGRREVPGRPTLWGTTPQFLAQFGLKDIRDLPQRTDLLLETPQPSGVSNAPPLTTELQDPSPEAQPPPGQDGQPGIGPQPEAGEEASTSGHSAGDTAPRETAQTAQGGQAEAG